MGFTVLNYELATGGTVTDSDMSAVTDQEFSQRNSHFIFTEDYRLKWAMYTGATATRANIQVPSWNAIGRFNIWPINLSSANVTSPPRIQWFSDGLPILPQNEEITVKATDGASENCAVFLGLMTPGHTRNLPASQLIIPVRATCTITQVANGWAGPAALVFEQALRGGVYSIIGSQCVGSGTFAYRYVFPRSRFYKGRRIRPGFIAQQAIGDQEDPRLAIDPFYLGEWGRFHTFEPPQLEVYSIAGTSSIAHELRLWLAYLGQDEASLLDGWVSQGWQ